MSSNGGNDFNRGQRGSHSGYGGDWGQSGYSGGQGYNSGQSYSGGNWGAQGDMGHGWGSQSSRYGSGQGYGSQYGGASYQRNEYDRPSSGYGYNSPNYARGYRSEYRGGSRQGSYGNSDAGYNRGYEGRPGPVGYDNDRDWWDRASDEMSSWFGDEGAKRRREMDRINDNRGRGPRGYQRSDERIKEDINDRLSDDPVIDASDIDVEVSRGEVVLSGAVDDRSAKRRAEDLAEAISGVRNVENRLRVSRGNEDSALRSNVSSNNTSGNSTTERSTTSRTRTTS